MNKVKLAHLARKIPIDDAGHFVVVGELSKRDLQLLVCALADDIQKEKQAHAETYLSADRTIRKLKK